MSLAIHNLMQTIEVFTFLNMRLFLLRDLWIVLIHFGADRIRKEVFCFRDLAILVHPDDMS